MNVWWIFLIPILLGVPTYSRYSHFVMICEWKLSKIYVTEVQCKLFYVVWRKNCEIAPFTWIGLNWWLVSTRQKIPFREISVKGNFLVKIFFLFFSRYFNFQKLKLPYWKPKPEDQTEPGVWFKISLFFFQNFRLPTFLCVKCNVNTIWLIHPLILGHISFYFPPIQRQSVEACILRNSNKKERKRKLLKHLKRSWND